PDREYQHGPHGAEAAAQPEPLPEQKGRGHDARQRRPDAEDRPPARGGGDGRSGKVKGLFHGAASLPAKHEIQRMNFCKNNTERFAARTASPSALIITGSGKPVNAGKRRPGRENFRLTRAHGLIIWYTEKTKVIRARHSRRREGNPCS